MTNQLSNGETIDEAVNAGPLTKEEGSRRAQIMLYNELVEMYDRKIAHLTMFPNIHPETRQVVAMMAESLSEIAMEILVELGDNK